MNDAQSTTTPLPQGTQLRLNDGELLSPLTPYHEAVGSLIHLANCTHPDISFAVSMLS